MREAVPSDGVPIGTTQVPSRRARVLRRHPPDRTCEADGCQTVLSTYNATARCWIHEERHAYQALNGRPDAAARIRLSDLIGGRGEQAGTP